MKTKEALEIIKKNEKKPILKNMADCVTKPVIMNKDEDEWTKVKYVPPSQRSKNNQPLPLQIQSNSDEFKKPIKYHFSRADTKKSWRKDDL